MLPCNRQQSCCQLRFCVHTVDLAKPGEYLVFRNARIDMFRGSMRLAVNEWGKVEAAEPNQDFDVKVIPPLNSTSAAAFAHDSWPCRWKTICL